MNEVRFRKSVSRMALSATLAGAAATIEVALFSPVTSAATAGPPNCSAVSVWMVKAALGGSPSTPSIGSTTILSPTGGELSTVDCDYGTVTISYSTRATVAEYKTQFAMAQLAAAAYDSREKVTQVSGIGNDAFNLTISGRFCPHEGNGPCIHSIEELDVLVTGKTYFEITAETISGSVNVAHYETLAKEIVSLV